MANGFSMASSYCSKPNSSMLRSAIAWIRAMRAEIGRLAEQVREALLQLQVLGHRHLAPDRRARGDLAVLRLEQREEAGLDGEARELDRVLGRRAPAERTRHEDVDVARAADPHRVRHLALEVAQVGDARGRDVRNAVRHRDPRHVLAGAEDVAGRGPDRRRRRGARRRRRRARALHAGVHVRLVVVADVEHVVVALEHARQAAEADVGRAAVAALRDHADVAAAERALRRRDARGDRRGVAEQRMDPRNLPRRLRIRRREHFEAAGRVDGDQLVVGRRASPRRSRSARRALRRSPGTRGVRS